MATIEENLSTPARPKAVPPSSIVWQPILRNAREQNHKGPERYAVALVSLVSLLLGIGMWMLSGQWSIDGAKMIIGWLGFPMIDSYLWWLLPIGISIVEICLKRQVRSGAGILLAIVLLFDAFSTALPLVDKLGIYGATGGGIALAFVTEWLLLLGSVRLWFWFKANKKG